MWQTVGHPIYEAAMVAVVDERLSAGDLMEIREIDQLRLDGPVDA